MKGTLRLLWLALAEVAAVWLLSGGILFGAAGTVRAPMLWLYVVVNGALYLLAVVLVYLRSPELLQERMKPGAGEQDRVSIAAAMALLLLHYVIAGLDAGRYHWSGQFPVAIQAVGLVSFAASFLFVLWPMLVNPFFSSAVRLQADRGQQVITSGPYRFIRHPGYTGGILFLASSGIALGSWLSVLPMLAAIGLIVRRTLLEDRMLKNGLPGYAEYMKRVPYRLIPGVW